MFRDERSDFLSLLTLWQFFDAQVEQKLSHRKQVDACRAHFVSHLRLRGMARRACAARERARGAGVSSGGRNSRRRSTRPKYQAIHEALLAGLLGNIGVQDGDNEGYAGARGIRFFLHPGSGLAKKRPKWVLAAELVETSRLFARCAAKIEPEWVEAVAGDRVTRDYFEPRWDEARGEVTASERVQLYGLTLVPRRRVSFGRIDPRIARDVFIRRGARPRRARNQGRVPRAQPQLVAEVADLEHKARRQDVLVDDETIARFYDERFPTTFTRSPASRSGARRPSATTLPRCA
jgi:ATP-dependent helicase HrpA